MMIIGGFILGASLVATAFAQDFWQVAAFMFIGGAGASAFQLLNNSLIMQNCDQAYYGRVMSLTMMAWGMNGVVGFPFGLLADATGERQTIFLMACLVLTVVTALSAVHVSLNRKSAATAVAVPTLAGGD
jgi:MFS family permease